MCGAIRMTLNCERSEHYINERWCYEQTDRRSAMIYHRICEAYICELVKKELTKSSRSYLCQGLALFVL